MSFFSVFIRLFSRFHSGNIGWNSGNLGIMPNEKSCVIDNSFIHVYDIFPSSDSSNPLLPVLSFS